MGRTRDQHPTSFFAFACWCDSYIRSVERAFPHYLPPPTDIPDDSASVVAELRDSARRFSAYIEIEGTEELTKLQQLGVTLRADQLPDLASYLAETVSRRSASHLLLRRDPTGVTEPDPYRPSRDIIVGLIVGTHVTLGSGNRTATAGLLNEGIARSSWVYSITPYEVRNALTSWMRRRTGDLDRAVESARYLGFRALHLADVWRSARAMSEYRGLAGIALAEQLWRDGRLLDMCADAMARHPTLPEIDELSIGQLLLGTVDREIRKRAKGLCDFDAEKRGRNALRPLA